MTHTSVSQKSEQKWQSRESILKSYLDDLSPADLLKIRPDYWALRFAAPKGACDLKYNSVHDDLGRFAESGGNSKRPANQPLEKIAGRRRVNEAACDFQYKQDTFKCNLVKTPLCWASANERYAACLSGRPIPDLRF